MRDAIGTEVMDGDTVAAAVGRGDLEMGRVTRRDHMQERCYVRFEDAMVDDGWVFSAGLVVTARGRSFKTRLTEDPPTAAAREKAREVIRRDREERKT